MKFLSGHYRPTDDTLDSFLSYLKENGVKLDEVELHKANEDSDIYEESNVIEKQQPLKCQALVKCMCLKYLRELPILDPQLRRILNLNLLLIQGLYQVVFRVRELWCLRLQYCKESIPRRLRSPIS